MEHNGDTYLVLIVIRTYDGPTSHVSPSMFAHLFLVLIITVYCCVPE